MEAKELIELEYLENMAEKVEEILGQHVVGKTFVLEPGASVSQELVEIVAQVVIDVSVVNTAIRAFHVLPYVEDHLLMIDVQDKNQQTVASVIVSTTLSESVLTVDSAIAAFKTGAILARHEELLEEAERERQEQLLPADMVAG